MLKSILLGILLFFSLYITISEGLDADVTITLMKNNKIIPIGYSEDEGFTLFSPLATKTTYLIDTEGEIIHRWDSEYPPGNMAYLLSDGCIIRAGRSTLLAQTGGTVQKINWENEIIWDYTFASDSYMQHHDIEPMPSGNVLLVAREFKTRDDAIQAGRIPNTILGGILESEFIVEVRPNGPTSGEIVWEWHVWDHLIQDYDSTKKNFGGVSEHSGLIDINHRALGTEADWIHMNSIDYNQELDQIMVTSRNFGELWIIDHSTSIEESAGHTGGRYGKGGDILFRWGNPLVYESGTLNDQKLFSPHDATWIDIGCPGEGNILVFNNWAASVDEIVPPIDEDGFYNKTPGLPYGPNNAIWRYKSQDIYAQQISGAQRLPNGNTLICVGTKGYFLEVALDKKVVWQYTNPYGLINSVFKIRRYYEIFNNSNPPKSPTIYGPVKGKNGIMYNYTICTTDPENENVYYMIDWGVGTDNGWLGPFSSGEEIIVSHLWKEIGTYIVKVKAKDVHNTESDWATLEVSMPKNKAINTPFLNFLENYPHMFPLLRQLFGL